MKKQRRGLDRYTVLHDGWRSLVRQTTPLKICSSGKILPCKIYTRFVFTKTLILAKRKYICVSGYPDLPYFSSDPKRFYLHSTKTKILLCATYPISISPFPDFCKTCPERLFEFGVATSTIILNLWYSVC